MVYLIEKFRSSLFLFVNFIFKNDHISHLTPCDILFICHDVDRPISLLGKAYSPLCDSLREDFESRGYSCLSLAHFNSRITGDMGFGFPISIENKRNIYNLFNNLLRLTNLKNFRINVYDFIFDKCRPKVVIVIGATDELVKSANNRQIVSVELLHGIGYKTIPWGWNQKSAKLLPRVILSLDELSTITFSPLRKKGIKIFTVPHPFLKRFLPGNEHLLPEKWKRFMPSDKKYFKTILISLVWGYAGDHYDKFEYANILENGLFYSGLEDLIKENRNICWLFRLHPVHLQLKKYSSLRKFVADFVRLNNNCEWELSSSLPFPTVAKACDGNISMTSLSCYDAACVGLPSLLLCPTLQPGGKNEDWFSDLVEEGYAIKMKFEKNKVYSWVKKVNKLSPRLNNLNDQSSWENAVNCILNFSEF